MKKRKIIIGDIHGCIDELHLLLKKVNYNNINDQLICVGDLTDRGPGSREVVDFFMKEPCAIVVNSNHDEKYARCFNHDMKVVDNPKYKNPMKLSSEKTKVYNSLSVQHLKYLQNLPLMYQFDDYIVVHGGLENRPLEQQVVKNVIRIRYLNKYGNFASADPGEIPHGAEPWPLRYYGNHNVIYGHNVWDLKDVRIHKMPSGYNAYGIDTGCCFGGNLTAMIIDNDNISFEQVKALKEYGNLI